MQKQKTIRRPVKFTIQWGNKITSENGGECLMELTDYKFDDLKLYSKAAIVANLKMRAAVKFSDVFDTLPKLNYKGHVYYLGSTINRAAQCIKLGFKPNFKMDELNVDDNTNYQELSHMILSSENEQEQAWLKKWSPYYIETHIKKEN